MRRRRSARGTTPAPALTALVASVALLAAACEPARERVVVGVALSPHSQPAVRLAVEEINAAGGIGGTRLEVESFDPAWLANPEASLAWSEALAGDPEVAAVIGHSDSAATLAAAGLYDARGLPHVVTIATHPAITDIGEWTYRICLSDAVQGRLLADHARDRGFTSAAIVHVNDDYGVGLATHFGRRFSGRGGRVVATHFHPDELEDGDRTMLEAFLRDLRAGGAPEVIVLVQRSPAVSWTLRALRRAGLDAELLAADNAALALEHEIDPSLWEGVHLSKFFLADPENPRERDFAERFREATGRHPEYPEALAHDAVHLVAQALAEGGLDRRSVKRHLDRLIREHRVVEGIAGPYRLNADRDAVRAMHVVEVQAAGTHLVRTFLSEPP